MGLVAQEEGVRDETEKEESQKGGTNTVSSATVSPSQTARKKALNNGSEDITKKDIETARNTLEGIKKKLENAKKCGRDIVNELNEILYQIIDYGEDYGNQFLISSGLIKKSDIYRLFLNLDTILADFLKKPEDTGIEKQNVQSNNIMTNMSDDLCEAASYEECLDIGCDKTYDANNTASSIGTSVGIGKSFVKLGIEKFDYKYEDVCFIANKEKLEVFFQKNKELKLMFIHLLDSLTSYNQLSDKSLQDYMESSLSGDELTESQKKNFKSMEEKDMKKATEKEETIKKTLKELTEKKTGGGMHNKKTSKKPNKKTNKRKINKKNTTRKL